MGVLFDETLANVFFCLFWSIKCAAIKKAPNMHTKEVRKVFTTIFSCTFPPPFQTFCPHSERGICMSLYMTKSNCLYCLLFAMFAKALLCMLWELGSIHQGLKTDEMSNCRKNLDHLILSVFHNFDLIWVDKFTSLLWIRFAHKQCTSKMTELQTDDCLNHPFFVSLEAL